MKHKGNDKIHVHVLSALSVCDSVEVWAFELIVRIVWSQERLAVVFICFLRSQGNLLCMLGWQARMLVHKN